MPLFPHHSASYYKGFPRGIDRKVSDPRHAQVIRRGQACDQGKAGHRVALLDNLPEVSVCGAHSAGRYYGRTAPLVIVLLQLHGCFD